MRVLRALLMIVAVLAAVPAWAGEAEWRQFAQSIGLRDVDGFVAAVSSLRANGRLPPRFVTKSQAERLGWRPGRPPTVATTGMPNPSSDAPTE